MQLALHHRHLLRAQADGQLGVLDRLAVGIAQLDLALDRLAGSVVGLVQREIHVEMWLDVLGHAEGAAVGVAAVVEAQRIAAGQGIGGQREARVGAVVSGQRGTKGGQRRAVGIQHFQLDIPRRRGAGLGGVAEIAADELDPDFVAWAVQRPVGEGVQLGVVDLAVVVEILRDKRAAGRVHAQQVAALRAGVGQVRRTVGASGGTLQHAQAIGPGEARAGNRAPALALRGPDQHAAAGALGDGHGIGHKQQGMGAVGADDAFHDVQARLELAQRHHHVAGIARQEFAAAAFQLDVLGRRDFLGVPDRVAEALDHVMALERLVLRIVLEAGRLGNLVAHAELRRVLHRLAAGRERQHALPCAARLLVPAIPQVGQGIGQPFAAVVRLDVEPVQVLLRLQEGDRIGDPVHEDVGAAVALQFALVFAARGFQAHLRRLVAAIAGVREQKERLALEGAIAA